MQDCACDYLEQLCEHSLTFFHISHPLMMVSGEGSDLVVIVLSWTSSSVGVSVGEESSDEEYLPHSLGPLRTVTVCGSLWLCLFCSHEHEKPFHHPHPEWFRLFSLAEFQMPLKHWYLSADAYHVLQLVAGPLCRGEERKVCIGQAETR